ncbi:YeiH family protein [Streptomyces sp. LHD-70]|uniref:YeiH family protein n=1 Tax=Streptomyces sp. LHD-70 TaxID=3072140 RepID=UPI00280F38A1|nr:YeiH family protein [Streptomyces sp. LHD-70]MDQ8707993.1 YeiH family protein [Streptomyces sp. LHD-70]
MSEDLDRQVTPSKAESASAAPPSGHHPEPPRPSTSTTTGTSTSSITTTSSAGAAALVPGLALALAIAVAATAIGKVFPLVGGPVAGIVLGVLIAALLKPGPRWRPGIAFGAKRVLQISVVVLGSQLSLTQMVQVGVSSLPVMIGSLVICLACAYGIGRWLGVVRDLRTLIGVGTGVCGASAIAATAPVIRAAGVDVAYAVSTIFLFNVAAVLTFPLIGHLLGMSQQSFGLFAGTAVNDTSSVVAAAATYGPIASNHAVVVKLTRTLMIIPICLGLAWLVRRRDRAASDTAAGPRLRVVKLVPVFLVGFLLMTAANSLGLIPAAAQPALSELSVFLITVALAATGLSTDLAGLRRTGPRPLVLGACLWIVVSVTSLVLQYLTGTL